MDNRNEISSFYYFPNIGDDEVLCGGSDTEQSEAQIQAKRKRYQEQAGKISIGQLPVILSATLKGPFERHNGWENPWRSQRRQHTKPEAGRLPTPQPRKNRRVKQEERVSVARQKPTASSAKEAAVRFAKRDKVDDGEGADAEHDGFQSRCHRLSSRSIEPGNRHPDIDDGYRRKESFCDDNNNPRRLPTDDLSWLKGSYISRRARWDNPAISSPTPIQKQLSRGNSLAMTTAHDALDVEMFNRPYRGDPIRRTSVNGHACQKDTIAEDIIRERFSVDDDFSMQAQETLRTLPVPDRQRTMSVSINTNSPIQVVPSPHLRLDNNRTAPRGTKRVLLENIESISTPTETECASSFVTEIAPSCRDLEKFRFKKKRKLLARQARIRGTDFDVACPDHADSSLCKGGSNEDVCMTSDIILPKASSSERLESDSYKISVLSTDDNEEGWETIIGDGNDLLAETHATLPPEFKDEIIADASLSSNSQINPEIEGDADWETTIGHFSCADSLPMNSTQTESLSNAERYTTAKARELISQETPLQVSVRPPRESSRMLKTSVLHDLADAGECSTFTTYRKHKSAGNLPENLPENDQESFERCLSINATRQNDFERAYQTGEEDMVDQNSKRTQSSNTTHKRTSQAMNTNQSSAPSRHELEDLKDNSSPKPLLRRTPPVYETGHSNSIEVLLAPAESSTQSVITIPGSMLAKPNVTLNVLPDILNSPFESSNFFHNSPNGLLNQTSFAGSHTECQIDATTLSTDVISSAIPVLKTRKLKLVNEKLSQMPLDTPLDTSDAEGTDNEYLQNSKPRLVDMMDRNELEYSHFERSTAGAAGAAQAQPAFEDMEQPCSKSSTSVITTATRLTSKSQRDFSQTFTDTSMSTRSNNSRIEDEELPTLPRSESVGRKSDATGHSATTLAVNGSGTRRSSPLRFQSPWEKNRHECPPETSHQFEEICAYTGSPTMHRIGLGGGVDQQSQWQPFGPALLPLENFGINPSIIVTTPQKLHSAESVTPTNNCSSRKRPSRNNPWASTQNTVARIRSNKRVSFGNNVERSHKSTPQSKVLISPLLSRESSSSEIDYIQDRDEYTTRKIISLPIGTRDCFTTRRDFVRILPEKSISQLNSSPAPVEAMAEAFVAAEIDSVVEQDEDAATSHHLRPSTMDVESPWTSSGKLPTSVLCDPVGDQENVAFEFLPADFDIDEALGEANDFLEDWSVEVELKKAREEENTYETNSMRRRKLFGIA